MSTRIAVPILCALLAPIVDLQPASAQTAPNPVVALTGSLQYARNSHTATLLPNNKVLVAGGGGIECSGTFPFGYYCYITVNHTAELYDTTTGTWTLTGNLSQRTEHSATLLPDGNVLVVGGVNYRADRPVFEYLDTAELFDPSTGLWRATQSSLTVRGRNDALLLPSGKVLVVGRNSADQAAAELFDPSNESWSITEAPLSRYGYELRRTLVLLPSGDVLHAFGDSAQSYNPASETWSSAGKFNAIGHVGSMTLLRNGLVLAIGRRSDWSDVITELYDPASRTWRLTGQLNRSSAFACACSVGTTALLSNGKVLLAGGYDFAEVLVNAPGPVELYDPVSETWTVMPYLFVFRDSPTATLLPNDKVLFAGGINENFQAPIFHRSAELFDPGLPRPTSLSISPLVVSQGECFTIAVGNGEGMTLDVQYRLDDSPIKTLTQWPKLDERGMAENICTSAQTPTGKYEFTGIRNTDTTPWLPVSSSLVVTPP